MKAHTFATAVCGILMYAVLDCEGQEAQNLAMNCPDEFAWRLFLRVNADAGGGKALFETWASDSDTFVANPQFPSRPSPFRPHPPVIPTTTATMTAARAPFAHAIVPMADVPLVQPVPPDPIVSAGEEVRRNKAGFTYIVANNLYRVSGLKAKFGTAISFPTDAIEVKGDWVMVSSIPKFTKNRVSQADVPKLYHLGTTPDGTQYALVGMHIISKAVPNWTWATFEHSMNPSRCDVIGCLDRFGAVTHQVDPNSASQNGYPTCVRSKALARLIAAAHWDPNFVNYCLKGTQTDFVDNTGLATRLGNSVIEGSDVLSQSSCMSCHASAAWDNQGAIKSNIGLTFSAITGPPTGPINPTWFWKLDNVPTKPAPYVGQAGITRIGTSADFVWSIALCAFDDVTGKTKRGMPGKITAASKRVCRNEPISAHFGHKIVWSCSANRNRWLCKFYFLQTTAAQVQMRA